MYIHRNTQVSFGSIIIIIIINAVWRFVSPKNTSDIQCQKFVMLSIVTPDQSKQITSIVSRVYQ